MFNPVDVLNMTLAGLIGGAIGFERQWNQGLAGLRTNTLVAFGAASFMALHVEQTAAYIVTGIGFLCAGVIFREGASVRGLNTATTMWCTAAAGALAGGGFYVTAIFCGAGVIAINLGVRHLQELINRYRPHPVDVETDYLIEIDCSAEQEGTIRTLLASGNWQNGLGLKSLHSRRSESRAGMVHVSADYVSHFRLDDTVEELVARIGLEQGVFSARWSLPGLIGAGATGVDRLAAVP
jgi:putative Mg2+ transporter-C (MgtC) family protein